MELLWKAGAILASDEFQFALAVGTAVMSLTPGGAVLTIGLRVAGRMALKGVARRMLGQAARKAAQVTVRQMMKRTVRDAAGVGVGVLIGALISGSGGGTAGEVHASIEEAVSGDVEAVLLYWEEDRFAEGVHVMLQTPFDQESLVAADDQLLFAQLREKLIALSSDGYRQVNLRIVPYPRLSHLEQLKALLRDLDLKYAEVE